MPWITVQRAPRTDVSSLSSVIVAFARLRPFPESPHGLKRSGEGRFSMESATGQSPGN